MSALFSFSLAVSLFVALLFPVLYQLIVRSTWFRFNRLVLAGSMVLCLVLPLTDIPALMSAAYGVTLSGLESVDAVMDSVSAPVSSESETVPQAGFGWIALAVLIYWAGIAVLLCREVWSYVRLFRLVSRSRKTACRGYVLCRLSGGEMSPCCWGRYIFLTESDDDNSPNSILIHELAHTKRMHWVDVLFADLFCIFLWYNPFAWMTRGLVKLNHEFEADEAVIESGADVYDYQHLLVTKAIGSRAPSVSNSFTAGKRRFRRRVLTVSRKRSSRKTMLLAACAIPALAIGLLLSSTPLSARVLADISGFEFPGHRNGDVVEASQTVAGTEKAPETGDEKTDSVKVMILPQPYHDQKPLAELLRTTLESSPSGEAVKVNIQVVIGEDGKIREVTTDHDDDSSVKTAVDKLVNSVMFEKMLQDGKPIRMSYNIPVEIRK